MLRGTLDTFSAGELLWLVGRSPVTGVLRVRGQSSGAIHCREGFVTWATVDDRVDIVDVLAAAGVVPAGLDPTAAADQIEAELRNGPSAQRIHDLVRHATEAAIFEMAAWGEGEVGFDTGAPHRFGHSFCYPVVGMLDAVRRRRARWSELVERIGGVDHIVAAAPAAHGDDDMTVTRSQLRLLAVVDGQRDLQTLAQVSGLGLFGTAELVATLIDAGLVVVYPSNGAPRLAPVVPVVSPPAPVPPAYATVAAPDLTVLTGPGGGAEGAAAAPVRHLSAVPTPAFGAYGDPAPAPAPVVEPLAEEPTLAALARELGLPDADYIDATDKPSRDLILRLLSAVKEI